MKFREWLMLCCSGLLIIACAVTFLRYGTHQLLIRQLGWNNAWTQAIFADNESLQHFLPPRSIPPDEISVDWPAKYPFATPRATTKTAGNAFQNASSRFHQQAEKFAVWTSQQFLCYQRFVEMMQSYRKAVGWNISLYSDIFSTTILPDGHLAGFQRRVDVSHPIASTVDFANFCRAHGINFLVVLAPTKIARSDVYSEGLDASNANGDAFAQGLVAQGIHCLDLRTFIEQPNANQHDFFFKSDHHWKPETARQAAQNLDDFLNAHFDYAADPFLLAPENFEEVCYPARHLGSFGQHATLSRVKPDDISLFYPKFPNFFHLHIPSMQLESNGDFSILYDMKKLDTSHGYYSTYVYAAYLYGERALISIHNLKKTDGRKLLLVRDSFSNAMAPFLSLGMEYLDTIDLRCFFGSLRTYIERERPDTVIVCYTVSIFDWDRLYPRSVFDFQ